MGLVFLTTVKDHDTGLEAHLEAPMYMQHGLSQGGHLADDDEDLMRESNAAWHLAKLAIQSIESVTQQATLQGEVDQTISLRNLTKSIQIMYGVADLNRIMMHMPDVRAEAFRCGIKWDDRFQAWLDSGGRAYDEVTREPPKHD